MRSTEIYNRQHCRESNEKRCGLVLERGQAFLNEILVRQEISSKLKNTPVKQADEIINNHNLLSIKSPNFTTIGLPPASTRPTPITGINSDSRNESTSQRKVEKKPSQGMAIQLPQKITDFHILVHAFLSQWQP
ncbi:hypothetical protein NDY24_16170 [Xanthomonas hortorum pv. pelargonii]|nr:hypothetical protein NDY24_16170 [Xanthomonas hortorum pv. pelargonii]